VRTLARPSAGYGSYRRGAEEIPPVIPAGVSVAETVVALEMASEKRGTYADVCEGYI